MLPMGLPLSPFQTRFSHLVSRGPGSFQRREAIVSAARGCKGRRTAQAPRRRCRASSTTGTQAGTTAVTAQERIERRECVEQECRHHLATWAPVQTKRMNPELGPAARELRDRVDGDSARLASVANRPQVIERKKRRREQQKGRLSVDGRKAQSAAVADVTDKNPL